jgi:hypothetical protein
MACSFEHGNEPSGSVKGEEFPECPRTTGFARRAQLHRVDCLLQFIFSHICCLKAGWVPLKDGGPWDTRLSIPDPDNEFRRI